MTKDKNNVDIKNTDIDGFKVSGQDENILQRLNKGILNHHLQMSELYIIELILKFMCDNNLKSMFDLGCGKSVLGLFCSENNIKYIGIDIDESAIKYDIEYNIINSTLDDIHYFCSSLNDYSRFLTDDTDVIIMWDVIEHFKTMKLAINFFEKLIKNSSNVKYFIIITPMRKNRINRNDIHNYEFSREEFQKLIKENKLHIKLEVGLNCEEYLLDEKYFKMKNLYGSKLLRSLFSFNKIEDSKDNLFILEK